MKVKGIMSLMLCILMLMTMFPLSGQMTIGANASTADVDASNSINIGDCITLGRYKGEPIVWRCVGVDENGPLMLSEKILCFKSFDAKGNHGNYYRNKEGTNNWNNSCLRHWLNSYGVVDWADRPATPSVGNVFNGYNPYANELGFLSSFSPNELSAIKAIEQKTYLNALDSKIADGGTSEYEAPWGSFETVFNNVETIGSNKWYQLVTDRFFLLDYEQASMVYNNLGAEFLLATATVGAVEADTSKLTNINTPYQWWMRTPRTEGMSYENVCVVQPSYKVGCASAFSVLNGNKYQSVGVRPAFYLNGAVWQQEVKRVDGFNFYMNHSSNYINVGMSVELHTGYYLGGLVDDSTDEYIYTNSNSNVLKITDLGWSDRYGQKLKLTALKEGASVITVTHPESGESASLDVYVSSSGSGWNFYNIPRLTYEEGKTTNFYNYSGMVVDEFAYKEHKNENGDVDYYTVTMTVWNTVNLYGAVTSHNPDGSLYSYQIIEKMDDFDTSFVSSLKSLYYNCGDLYYLIKNPYYYSGKSDSTENEIEIKVPVGGQILISNNCNVSGVANLVNFLHVSYDLISLLMDASGFLEGDDKYVIKDSKNKVINSLIVKTLAEKELADTVTSSLKSAAAKSFEQFDLRHDDLKSTVQNVIDTVFTETGVNFMEEMKDEFVSVTGLASVGEAIATKVLPTGFIIEALYTGNSALDYTMLNNNYCNSSRRPSGIHIYAPTDSTKFVSNGISVDTQEDSSETVLHAYTVTGASMSRIYQETFWDASARHANSIKTYNITLYKNGVESQPQSPVTVQIPIPSTMNRLDRSSFKVYRNNDDGTFTNMNARVEGDYLVFVTDHFSYYSVVDESEPQLTEELKFSGASLTLQDALTVNYKVDQTLLAEAGYEDPYVLFAMNDVEIVVRDYRIVDGKLVFDFEDIAPNQMGDTIYATLYAYREGAVYQSATRQYCVTDYCYNMLGKYPGDEYAELRTLLVDILHYGAASQIFSNYKTDALVNQALTAKQLAWGTADVPTMTDVLDREYVVIDTPSVNWKGAGLNLLESVTMRFKLQADSAEDLSVRITDDAGDLWIIYEDQFEVIEGGYYVYFDGFNADEMSKNVYLTVYDGINPVSNTIRYSIESYAASKQNNTDANLSVLVNAMMKYGNSAYSYVN